MTKIFEAVKAALIGGLDCLIAGKDKPYACDLHHVLYNEPQHYIYTAEAKEATAELNVWECIGVVQTYEKEHFGEVYTPLSNACAVANMVVYILGEALLYEIFNGTEYFGNKWNEELSTDDLKEMLTIAEEWFEENPDGLQEIWDNLDIA